MTTELEKIQENQEESQTIGNFLEWLDEQDYDICAFLGRDYHAVNLNTEQLLAGYFDIDLAKAEKERVVILDGLRK